MAMGLDGEEKKVIEEVAAKEDKTEVVVCFKQKRKPFACWSVGGKDYKLKLKSSEVCMLEEKFKKNMLELLTGSGVPPLNVMLSVIQGAMLSTNHGIKYREVLSIYDCYTDEGGTYISLFTDVIMEVLKVSGFFTRNQAADMEEKIQEVKETM